MTVAIKKLTANIPITIVSMFISIKKKRVGERCAKPLGTKKEYRPHSHLTAQSAEPLLVALAERH